MIWTQKCNCLHGEAAKILNCETVVSEFESIMLTFELTHKVKKWNPLHLQLRGAFKSFPDFFWTDI